MELLSRAVGGSLSKSPILVPQWGSCLKCDEGAYGSYNRRDGKRERVGISSIARRHIWVLRDTQHKVALLL